MNDLLCYCKGFGFLLKSYKIFLFSHSKFFRILNLNSMLHSFFLLKKLVYFYTLT